SSERSSSGPSLVPSRSFSTSSFSLVAILHCLQAAQPRPHRCQIRQIGHARIRASLPSRTCICVKSRLTLISVAGILPVQSLRYTSLNPVDVGHGLTSRIDLIPSFHAKVKRL